MAFLNKVINMKGKKVVFAIFLLFSVTSFITAQEKFTINGYIKDSLSGETLIGANVAFDNQSKGVTSNQYGFYSLTLNKGTHTLTISFVGYKPKQLTVNLNTNLRQDILLTPQQALVTEVTVVGKKRENNVKTAQMGKIDVSVATAKALPSFLGEVDLLKTIQLLPGVRNAGEGNAGFYVRGGGPDQNLILLDDAVVYNTGHLFGFFSVFNADAIKNVTLIKGGMPAQYGGRISSVIDISMKDGNINKTEMEGGIGLIASRFSLQGPIKKDKASYIISARRTYVDALVKPFIKPDNQFYGSGYYFYDVNAKINYKLTEKDKLYLSGYFGRDDFQFKNSQRSFSTRIPWGNATGTLRWNHIFNKKLFANTSLVYNDYNFKLAGSQENFNITFSSGVRDVNVKSDFDWYINPEHKIKFGVLYTYHTFFPSVLNGNQDSVTFQPQNALTKYANEYAAYLQDEWEFSKKIKINYGVRLSAFQQIGSYTTYTTDANGNRVDSFSYKKGETVKLYAAVEPRFTLKYEINEQQSIKAAITRNAQYIHLVTNAGTTLPTDLWVPSTLRVKPQMSWQYALGYFRNFNNNMFETSVEVYYKNMSNQIEYREGFTPNTLKDTEEDFVFGKGWSYGAEFFINKVKGRLTGWVGYTLSWSWRQFPDLNEGRKYPARFDRRHDASIVAAYQLNEKWKLSAVFVYGTGQATSLPERFYFMNGVLTQDFSSINKYRLAPYHRLDFAATYTPIPKKERKIKSSWVFSIYNVYSRLNPYFVYFQQEGGVATNDLKVQAKQVSLFPIIPSVTWNFKF